MAYADYGGWVHRNNEHTPQWEDSAPYAETQVGGAAMLSYVAARTQKLTVHHVVLGQGPVRLCGHKTYPLLYLDGVEQEIEPFMLPDEDGQVPEYVSDAVIEGELAGCKFSARACDANMLHLRLAEPDGTLWRAVSGYGYGAGHQRYEPGVKCLCGEE